MAIANEKARAYLERIGYEGTPDGSADCLGRLQEAHLRSVPYENLDILAGVPLSLDIDRLFDKIVVRRRGGYCFELNSLFGWLLRELGYEVVDWVARFWRDETMPVPKRRHQVLGVRVGETTYLCDAGVGGIIPLRPVRLVEGLEQTQGDECYRLDRATPFGWMLSERKEEAWRKIYSFTEEPQLAPDFVMASYWCEHAPESIFAKRAMLSIRNAAGRCTIAGRDLKIFSADGVTEVSLTTDEEFDEALRAYFGIRLSAGKRWTE